MPTAKRFKQIQRAAGIAILGTAAAEVCGAPPRAVSMPHPTGWLPSVGRHPNSSAAGTRQCLDQP
ncbi:MAG TPA: hypothetical protein VGD52_08325 [Pseudoduganella sp.]